MIGTFNSVVCDVPVAAGIQSRSSIKSLNVFVAFLVCMWSVLGVGIPVGLPQTLSFNSQQGNIGDTVSFTIRIDGAPNVVEAFGFDVVYDPNVLQYTGSFSPQEMVSGFNFFNVNELSPGRARVAGFSVGNQIETGNSGRMVTLEFAVINPGNATLALANLVDDVAGWSTQAGVFESLTVPTPSEPTEEVAQQSVSAQPEEAASTPIPQTPVDQTENLTPEPAPPSTEEAAPQPATPETAPQPVATLTQKTAPQPAPSQRSAVASRLAESPTTSAPSQAVIPYIITRSTDAGTTEPRTENKAVSAQRQTPSSNPAVAAGRVQPNPDVALPSGAPQSIVTESRTGSVATGRSALPPTASPNPAPVTGPAAPQGVAPEERQSLQQTAKLVPQERRVPMRESASDPALSGKSSDSNKDSRRMGREDQSSQVGGFLSQTSRMVLLIGALVMLCIVGMLWVSLKKR